MVARIGTTFKGRSLNSGRARCDWEADRHICAYLVSRHPQTNAGGIRTEQRCVIGRCMCVGRKGGPISSVDEKLRGFREPRTSFLAQGRHNHQVLIPWVTPHGKLAVCRNSMRHTKVSTSSHHPTGRSCGGIVTLYMLYRETFRSRGGAKQ